MKLPYLIILFLAGSFTITRAVGQANAAINVLTQNSGFVSIGGTVFLEVTINSTGPTTAISANKLKPQISVPSTITSIPATGHQLPAGWAILNNNGSTINLCNGSDVIAVGTSRTLLIAVQGNSLGGPLTVGGQLFFSSGASCGGPGSLPGDNTADNSSQSSIQVYDPVPVILTDFNAALVNCQPVLNWVTETEINSDRFEIERSNNNSDWISIGVVAAKGNSAEKSEYNFIDKNLSVSSEQVLYRLKMVDKDGHYKYSLVLRVFTNCKTTQVYVYPNPVQDGRLYVNLKGISGFTEANLLSLSGQVILKNKMNNGTNYLNVANIADGVYILNIKDTNGFDKKVKVFIQN